MATCTASAPATDDQRRGGPDQAAVIHRLGEPRTMRHGCGREPTSSLVEFEGELPLVMVEVKSWIVVRVRETHPVGEVGVPPRGKCHTAMEGCAALVVQVPVQ
jgi:hypothetical protein